MYVSIMHEIQNADIVITIGRDGIKTIKDRCGETRKLDLAKILELLIYYQEDGLKPLVQNWIDRLKVLRLFI